MNLLIVEPEASGHRMALYVRWIVNAAVRKNWNIRLLTTKRAIEHPAFKLVQADVPRGLDVIFMREIEWLKGNNPLALLFNQYKIFKSVRDAFQFITPDEKPDHVYMANLDYFDKIMAAYGSPFGNITFSGMMMNLKYHRQKMGVGSPSRSDWLYEKLFLRVLRIPTLRNVMVIDEPFLDYAKERHREEYSKLRFVPDVGELNGNETKDNARRIFHIPPERFVILVYGSLTRMKGIEPLLKAVKFCDQGEITILLAGTQDYQIKELIAEPLAMDLSKSGQLVESQGFHDETREYRVFMAADAVWLGYVGQSFGSSGVLYQASSIGLPVLATKEGLIGWLVKKHGIGLTFTPENKNAVAKAIGKLILNQEFARNMGENGRRLSKEHSGVKFGEAICNGIL